MAAKCEMDQVTIEVPSSVANVGPLFNGASIALKNPRLEIEYTRTPKEGIEIEVESPAVAPLGKRLGYTACYCY